MSERIAVPCLTWHSGVAPRALLLCLHGLGLHGGMFKAFGERAAKLGIVTHALDIRGFGAWRNLNCSQMDFPACLEDVRNMLAELRSKHPELPIYLLGESLGGAVTTRVAAEFPDHLDGAIVVSPARSICDHRAAIAKVLLSILTAPRMPINLSEVIARRAPHLVAAQHEPTVRLHFSLKELLHLSWFMRDALKAAKQIRNTPVLMLQGSQDQLISARSTLAFFEQIGASDKELVLVGDADHLMLQSPDVHPRALEIIARWINERSQRDSIRRAS